MTRTSRFAALLVLAAACAPVTAAPKAAPEADPSRPQAAAALAELPLSFVENRGQADPRVAYYVKGSDTSVYFTSTGLTFSLADRGGTSQRWVSKLDFVGGRADPHSVSRAEAIASFFKGDPSEWKTGVPTHSKISYEDLWPGIDLAYSGDPNRLKYELEVAPGADPGQIRLAYRGAELSLRDGGLVVSTPAGVFTDDAPRAWQVVDGRKIPVASSFDLDGNAYGFRLGAYDPALAVVIDPAILVYAGFIGGSTGEDGLGIAVDTAGAAYVTGSTGSTETTFPVVIGPDPTYNGATDAFVAKIAPSGASLVYAGFFGGTAQEYFPYGIDVDASGAAYIAGTTQSTEATGFPVIGGPDLSHNGGTYDVYVAKIAPSGASLIYSGFIGGNMTDYGNAIAVDASGAAYVTGSTSSPGGSFPVTVGPSPTNSGGLGDAFVAKVAPSGANLEYAGFIGGVGDDVGEGIDVDAAGAAYVTGYTESTEASFPESVGPDLTHNGGIYDVFVAKVAPTGASLAYAGFIGGSEDLDLGRDIAVDPAGAAYVAGTTPSDESTFPVAVGPDLTHNGVGDDAFVAKVHPSGSSLVYAGFIGGSLLDYGTGVAVDGSGAAFVAGHTESSQASFPVQAAPDLTFGEGTYDGYLAKVAPSGASLEYAGYLGGSGLDYGTAVAVDGAGAAYVTGSTTSTEASFPVAVGPDLSSNGGADAFVTKLSDNFCLGSVVTIQGTAGGETITGTAGADVIKGLGGNDTIDGAGGNDVICAGDGDDTLIGGSGDDNLDGEAGADTASFPGASPVSASLASGTASGLGADILSGMENLTGSAGNDTLTGNASANVIKGGDGDDTAFGGTGDDELLGEAGKDRLVGQAGNDLAVGGAKADRLSGGGGKDRLRGQGGKDRLSGGGANDRLAGGKGNDRLNGGKGKKDRCNGGKGKKDTATRCETVTGVP